MPNDEKPVSVPSAFVIGHSLFFRHWRGIGGAFVIWRALTARKMSRTVVHEQLGPRLWSLPPTLPHGRSRHAGAVRRPVPAPRTGMQRHSIPRTIDPESARAGRATHRGPARRATVRLLRRESGPELPPILPEPPPVAPLAVQTRRHHRLLRRGSQPPGTQLREHEENLLPPLCRNDAGTAGSLPRRPQERHLHRERWDQTGQPRTERNHAAGPVATPAADRVAGVADFPRWDDES